MEHQQNLQQLKEKFEINKQQQLEKNKHRSLPRSLTILEDSFHHNNEEIYKILIAHQQVLISSFLCFVHFFLLDC